MSHDYRNETLMTQEALEDFYKANTTDRANLRRALLKRMEENPEVKLDVIDYYLDGASPPFLAELSVGMPVLIDTLKVFVKETLKLTLTPDKKLLLMGWMDK